MGSTARPGAESSDFYFTAQAEKRSSNPGNRGYCSFQEILRGVREMLIVDDNRTNQRILEGMLRRWEMQTTAVSGAQAALEQLFSSWEMGRPTASF